MGGVKVTRRDISNNLSNKYKLDALLKYLPRDEAMALLNNLVPNMDGVMENILDLAISTINSGEVSQLVQVLIKYGACLNTTTLHTLLAELTYSATPASRAERAVPEILKAPNLNQVINNKDGDGRTPLDILYDNDLNGAVDADALRELLVDYGAQRG